MKNPVRAASSCPLLEDRLYSKALQGNSVGAFQRTWTSSTERAAIWEKEYLDQLRAGM